MLGRYPYRDRKLEFRVALASTHQCNEHPHVFPIVRIDILTDAFETPMALCCNQPEY